MKFHHIGIVVKDIKKNLLFYSQLGYTVNKIIIDQYQNNKIVFLTSKELPTIELVEPLNKESTINNAKPGYHHICYEIDSEELLIKNFNQLRIGKIFTRPITAPAINNRKVVFAYLRNGTIIEFILQDKEVDET